MRGGWGAALPYKRLMGMCRGWECIFHDWMDYNGVAFSIECFHMTSWRPYWCPQNNETAAVLVSQTSPVGVELLSYVNAFFCSKQFA